MPTSQDFKTTFIYNLTSIILSLRSELLFNLCREIPCNLIEDPNSEQLKIKIILYDTYIDRDQT